MTKSMSNTGTQSRNAQAPRSPSSRSLEVIVPVAGLLYSALLILYFFVQFSQAPGGPPPFIVVLAVFALAFLGAAVGVWRRSRVGYIAAIIITGIFIVFQGWDAIEAWAQPAVTEPFVAVTTILPTLVATFAYSILGLRSAWRKTAPDLRVRIIPRSSIIGLLAFGFILGGLVVGFMAGPTQVRLLASAGTSGDITMVQGAGSPSNPEFFRPASFQVRVGQTVTWVNRDANSHTVTSNSGAFDSGDVPSGGSWTHTFTQAGAYDYHCSPHPWMRGTVVVSG